VDRLASASTEFVLFPLRLTENGQEQEIKQIAFKNRRGVPLFTSLQSEEFEAEAERVNVKLKEQSVNIRFVISNDPNTFPFSRLDSKNIKPLPEPIKVIYADNQLMLEGVIGDVENGRFFSRGIGLVSAYRPKTMDDAHDKKRVELYKDFYNDGGISKSSRLISRMLYCYIPQWDRAYEFMDKSFFTKDEKGNLMTRKLPSPEELLKRKP
jgi:hypothetical protein